VIGVYNWASSATGRPVIWAYQDGPQPTPPYLTLHVRATAREGMADIGPISDEGIATIQQGQLLTVSVNSYGNGALDTLQDLRNALIKPSVQRALRADGLAYVDVLSLTDLPVITGTTWQARAVLDVEFRAAVSISDDLGVIETVAFNGDDGNASPAGDTVERD